MQYGRKSAWIAMAAALILASGWCYAQEPELSAADRGQMDPFEAQSIDKADKAFKERRFAEAVAGYDAFLAHGDARQFHLRRAPERTGSIGS